MHEFAICRASLHEDLVLLDLGVTDAEAGTVSNQAAAHIDSGRLPRVTGVLFRQNSDLTSSTHQKQWREVQRWILPLLWSKGNCQQLYMSKVLPHKFMLSSSPAGSRTNPVSAFRHRLLRCCALRTFLKAKPKMAIFLPQTVLNMLEMTVSTKRCFW